MSCSKVTQLGSDNADNVGALVLMVDTGLGPADIPVQGQALEVGCVRK